MNKQIKVGMFLILGIIIFFVGIFLIGRQQSLFGSTITLSTKFNSVSGLAVGNNVRYNGINVGTVSEIVLVNDSTVQVYMQVKSKMKAVIRIDSKCLISSEGLMGDKTIVISQGTPDAKHVVENDIIPSIAPVEIDQIINKVYNTMYNAEIISGELAIMLTNVNDGQGALGKLISDSTTAKDMTQLLDNLNSSSQSLDENLEAAKKSWILRGAFRKMDKEKNGK